LKKTIIFSALLFTIAILMAVFYFNTLNQNQRSQKRSLAHIPASAALLVSFNNDSNVYDIFRNYPVFKAILGITEMEDLHTLQHHFLTEGLIASLSDHQHLLLSFHRTETGINWLMNIPFARTIQKEEIRLSLEKQKNIHITAIDTSETTFFEIDVEGINRKLYAQIENSHVMISFSNVLLMKAMDKNADHLSKDFMDSATTRKNLSPLQLYINHETLVPFIEQFLSGKTEGTLTLFDHLHGISGFDFHFLNDAIMFSGISTLHPTDSGFLSLFLDQEPVNHQLKQMIVENIAYSSEFAASDYRRFQTNLTKLLAQREQLNQIHEQFRLIKQKKNAVIDDELLTVWGNEFAKVTLTSGEDIGIATVQDSLEFMQIAEKISTREPDSIFRFDHSNLLYYSFGDPFKEFRRPYFTYSKGFMITANNKATLKKYLQMIVEDELLEDNTDYKEYDKRQSNQSNYTFFVHRENASPLISQKLKQNYKDNFQEKELFGFQKFYAFSLQLSGHNGQFISNLYAQFDNTETDN